MLSNHTKRHRYNLYGLDGLSSHYQTPNSAPGVVLVVQPGAEITCRHMQPSPVVQRFVYVCMWTAGCQGPQQHGMQGQNVEAMLALTFMEAALGAERIFQASVRLHCPSCTGSGLSAELQPVDCVACNGTGQSMRCQTTSLGEQLP